MSTIVRVAADRRWSYVIAASLVLAGWLALTGWSLSPYAEWLDHAQMEHIGAPLVIRLAVFTLGWTLMVIAMMLPGTLLLMRGDSPSPIMPFLLAYLMVWAVFGNLSYMGDSVLHEIVEQLPALEGVIAPGVLLLAGTYELTPMKRFCLSNCRSESAGFKTSEPSSHRALWIMGLRHGVFCLGSYWALMLLMFATGGINLLWMLLLGTVMTIERLSPQGDNVARLLGSSLMLVSVLLVIV